MTINEPDFTIGVEEEYLLVDLETRDLVREPPAELFEKCEAALGDQVTPEFLRAQIEVGTRVCRSISEVRDELVRLRSTVATTAREFGLAPIAASTHPFAAWHMQKHTDKERYNALAEDMQVVARRLLTCGMHVHIGVDDPEMRIELLNQIPYFLPHLLALSTSSPFWGGDDTGLKSYRLSVFDELPRTGPPETFTSYGEYQRTVAVLVNAGLLEDATKLWWDVRPSARFPTIEMRITDICALLEDAVGIAALFRCLCRMLFRLRRENKRWRAYPRLLIAENRWRAQRYGIDRPLVDFGRGALVPYSELLDELIQLVAEDADAFDCVAEVSGLREILVRGTSAHRQRTTWQAGLDAGASSSEALVAVVDQLIAETVSGF